MGKYQMDGRTDREREELKLMQKLILNRSV